MADRPNIVVYADQHRFDCIGAYGKPDIRTPISMPGPRTAWATGSLLPLSSIYAVSVFVSDRSVRAPVPGVEQPLHAATGFADISPAAAGGRLPDKGRGEDALYPGLSGRGVSGSGARRAGRPRPLRQRLSPGHVDRRPGNVPGEEDGHREDLYAYFDRRMRRTTRA